MFENKWKLNWRACVRLSCSSSICSRCLGEAFLRCGVGKIMCLGFFLHREQNIFYLLGVG